MQFLEIKNASALVCVEAGEEIEVQANHTQLFKAEVPEGKIWKAKIIVSVQEYNVG